MLSFLVPALYVGAAEMLKTQMNPTVIYELLFEEGVMVAKKDVHMPNTLIWQTGTYPIFHVFKATQSLKSWGYVKEYIA